MNITVWHLFRASSTFIHTSSPHPPPLQHNTDSLWDDCIDQTLEWERRGRAVGWWRGGCSGELYCLVTSLGSVLVVFGRSLFYFRHNGMVTEFETIWIFPKSVSSFYLHVLNVFLTVLRISSFSFLPWERLMVGFQPKIREKSFFMNIRGDHEIFKSAGFM